MKRVDIVIVNWNSSELIDKCLDSICKTSHVNRYISNVIVVDNNSSDKSLEVLNKYENEIFVIKNSTNLGFGKACNLGAKVANSEFILFLNPDTQIVTNCIAEAVDYLDRDISISVLGCLQKGVNSKIISSCSSLPNLRTSINLLSGLSKISYKLFPDFHLKNFDYSKSCFVEHLMGSFYLIRRNIFENVGGFDEDFFVYQEDADLSKRIGLIGGRIFYNSKIEIFHETGGTSKSIIAKRVYYSLKALLLYGKKHFNIVEYNILLFVVLFISPFTRLIYSATKLSFNDCKDSIRAYYYLYRSLLIRSK